MNWVIKAATKKVLSYIPAGRKIDFFFQNKITKSLPASDASFLWSVRLAAMHMEQIRKYGSVGIEHAKFYEFGAGWDLIGPLAFYIMGARDQTLSDIAPNLKLSLINHSLARFHRLADEIREITGATIIPLPPSITSEIDLRSLGMEYIVADLEELSLAPAQFDYITSTCVLEHVPAGEIPPMLRKCHELLKPGGFLCLSWIYRIIILTLTRPFPSIIFSNIRISLGIYS